MSNQFGGTSQPPTSSGGHQLNQPSQYLTNQPFAQQLTQQQLRAQHQHRPSNNQNATQQHQNQQQQGYQQQQQSGMWQQILSNAQQQRGKETL